MLRLFVLTVPFLVMATLFYIGYLITRATFPGVMAIICLLIDVGILIRYNIFLRKAKQQRGAQPELSETEE